ncbi:MAG TPA: PilN domain-containing protein [Methylophilaceae bacterium]|nr:PilN domain-containing protein [Methylophilaceae bacterium]
MVRVNLLPHRQIRRAELQRQFSLMFAATVAAGAAIVFLGLTYINDMKESQDERNKRLDNAIVVLDKEIEEIKRLRTEIDNVLARKKAVEALQTDRSQAVMLLNEIAKQQPEGLYLKAVKQKDEKVVIEGVADSNARVAALMRNLSNSEWLESPQLVEIKSVPSKGAKQNSFSVEVTQKVQKPVEPVKPKGK